MGKAKLDELKVQCLELIRNRDELNERIKKNMIAITRIELLPFVEGQIVKCVVPAGRSKKEACCQIEIDENGQVWVRPIKEDGGLGGRRFKATPEDGKTYKDIFKEADR